MHLCRKDATFTNWETQVMYLLNAQQIKRHVEAPLGQYLDILNFDEKKLQHTAYYFSLGEDCEILTGTAEAQVVRLTPTKPYLNLASHGYAVVQTNETFFQIGRASCRERV